MAAVPAAPARSQDRPAVGYVDVSVATVWTDPGKPRRIDAPALTDPVDIEAWLSAMTTDQRRWLTVHDATQTQALYGTRLQILGSRPGWYEVAVTGQPTPKNPNGYPGWVPAAQVAIDPGYGRFAATRPFALVDRSALAWLYRDADRAHRSLQVSYDTRLPVLDQTAHAVEVAVPGGDPAWLAASAASVFASQSAIPPPTGPRLVAQARLFLHRPYLWGGASGYAFDCSGFTHTLYHANGITIGRDADAQADFAGHGTLVDRSDLRPGDLIFYASTPGDPATIDHVAMYVGGDRMIEAYGAGVPVRVTTVRSGPTYWGAERFLTPRETH